MDGFQFCSSGNQIEICLHSQQFTRLAPKADSDLGSQETEVPDPQSPAF